jgi:hypothetical protein
MSSATSIDPSAGGSRGKVATSRSKAAVRRAAAPAADEQDPGLRPWQFFVLAGMLSATAVVIVATGQSAAAIIVLSLTVLAASLVALAAHRTLVPLVRPETIQTPQILGGRTRAALEREKTLVLRSIKELEFDFAMKKMSQADFDEMAGRLRARAIGLMRQLDAGADYRETIEQELSRRLGKRGPTGPAPPAAAAAPLETGSEVEDAVVYCSSCGQPIDHDARFCKHCGAKVSA